MGNVKQIRVFSTIVYLLAIIGIHWAFIDPTFNPNLRMIWLFSGAIGLVLGSRLLHPHFTPPADAITNCLFAAIAMLPIIAADQLGRTAGTLGLIGLAVAASMVISGLIILLVKRPGGLEVRLPVLAWEKVIRGAGNPNVVFTAVILVAVITVHRQDSVAVIAILGIWTAIVALRPIDGIFDLLGW